MSTGSTVACKSCRGTGELTISSVVPLTIACSVCKGVGHGHYVEVPCAACGGARGLPCSRCGGSGLVTTFMAVRNETSDAAPAA
jgi:DnaJ-class molecular chaperone